jgi:formate dehydrogenase iron-sulfur subunit
MRQGGRQTRHRARQIAATGAKGLFGRPTVIKNVLSLCAVPHILADGAQNYADYGVGRSRGTMPIQLAGNIATAGSMRRLSA